MDKENFINVLDHMNEGIIAIDKQGMIKAFNKSAQEIFGIININTREHDAGKLEKGDIVIIADTGLGEDDGNLEANMLEKIGIVNVNIQEGDAFIAYGKYLDEKNNGEYKRLEKNKKCGKFLYDTVLGIQAMSTRINFDKKVITVYIGKEKYVYHYKETFGYMLILNGENGKIKFFQAKGFTPRRESVKDLLEGNAFMEKTYATDIKRLEEKSIFEVFPKEHNENIIEILGVAQNKELQYEKERKLINGIPTRCTLLNLTSEEQNTIAMLKIEDISELSMIIEERDNALASLEVARQETNADILDKYIGQSDGIKSVKSMARKAAATSSNILILGESGTGKGLLAKLIHKKSKRSEKPFIVVNCASIPESLIESEFFGYDGGAFTGAKKEGKKGYFELAEGGTLFLDEIGELPVSMQAKLLHVLQDRTFMRVGGTSYIHVDVRLITATNKELEKEVEVGNFRKDLYYRINVFPLYVPPLRMRREDIILLTYKLLPDICNRLEIEEKQISPEGLLTLEKYPWPGNVRELENVLEMSINICEEDTICKEHINITEKQDDNKHGIYSLQANREAIERKAMIDALTACGGNKRKAMEILNIKKSSFYDKLNKYNIKQ